MSNVSADSNVDQTPFAPGLTPGAARNGAGQLLISGSDATTARTLSVSFGTAPTAVGQSFALGASAGAGTAVLAYGQEVTSDGGFVPDDFLAWSAASGTVTVTALSACFLSFTIGQAAMVATSAPDGGSAVGTGTFLFDGSAANAWLPCGTLTGTVSAVTGNVDSSSFSASGPQVTDNGPFRAEGDYFPNPALNQPRQILLTVNGPVAAGQSFALSAADSDGGPTSASLYYYQSDNGTFGIDQCWISSAGTLVVDSLDQCVVTFSIAGATMVPQPQLANGSCDGLNDATGSFTLSVSGSQDAVSQ